METILRRHGDVMILTKKDFSIPKSVKMKVGTLIHKGNNNSHVVEGGQVLFGQFEGKKVLRVKKPTKVSHVGGSSTHATKPLPVGDYWVEIQSFYDHLTEEKKQVVD